MMQCKHTISFNKLFDLRTIRKCWYERNRITQSRNIGKYSNPRFKKAYTEIEDVDISH